MTIPRRSWPPSRPSTAADPPASELIQQNEALRRENAQLWDWLCQTIEFPPAKQQQFAVTALAMGLSLNQTLVLLAILLGAAAAPGRSTVHRWVQAAGTAAGAVLKRLDQAAKTLVLVGCLDEIFFHRRPVLVGVEPQSMVWFLGKKADNCQGCDLVRRIEALDGVAPGRLRRGLRAAGGHRRDPQDRRATRPSRSRWRRGWMSSTPSRKPAAP